MEFNRIKNRKVFDVSAFVSAYYFSTKPDFMPQWEQYDFSQFFFILSGSGVITTEEATYPIRPGMMIYRPAGKRSIYEWLSESVSFALISFICDSEAMKVFEGAPITLYEEESAALLDVMKTGARICEPIEGGAPLQGMRVKADVPDVVLSFIYASTERFLTMLYCRLTGIDWLLDESQKLNQFMLDSKLVAEIKRYLNEHLREKLTVEDVCRHFWLSPSAVTRKFRAETGKSIAAYFLDLKITEAKRAISMSSRRFTEISESLGFSSLNYFTKVFKQQTGMTPTAYSKYVSKRRVSVESQKPEKL